MSKSHDRRKNSKSMPTSSSNGKTSKKNGKAHVELESLRLDDLTRMNICRLEAEVRAAKAQYVSEQVRLNQYITSIDKDGIIPKMQATLQALNQQLATMQSRYSGAVLEVENRLHINLKEYSFDDESGILHKVVDSKVSQTSTTRN